MLQKTLKKFTSSKGSSTSNATGDSQRRKRAVGYRVQLQNRDTAPGSDTGLTSAPSPVSHIREQHRRAKGRGDQSLYSTQAVCAFSQREEQSLDGGSTPTAPVSDSSDRARAHGTVSLPDDRESFADSNVSAWSFRASPTTRAPESSSSTATSTSHSLSHRGRSPRLSPKVHQSAKSTPRSYYYHPDLLPYLSDAEKLERDTKRQERERKGRAVHEGTPEGQVLDESRKENKKHLDRLQTLLKLESAPRTDTPKKLAPTSLPNSGSIGQSRFSVTTTSSRLGSRGTQTDGDSESLFTSPRPTATNTPTTASLVSVGVEPASSHDARAAQTVARMVDHQKALMRTFGALEDFKGGRK